MFGLAVFSENTATDNTLSLNAPITACLSAPCSPSAETPDVYIVERLFSSSLVVVVSSIMPQRMNIYHFKKGTEICNYSYPNNILAVKLNRQVSYPVSHPQPLNITVYPYNSSCLIHTLNLLVKSAV